jgi:hypothetical protein
MRKPETSLRLGLAGTHPPEAGRGTLKGDLLLRELYHPPLTTVGG